MTPIKSYIQKYWLHTLGVIIGATIAYIYWLNWACTTGCPLTSTPIRTVIYGAILGYLTLSLFTKNSNKK